MATKKNVTQEVLTGWIVYNGIPIQATYTQHPQEAGGCLRTPRRMSGLYELVYETEESALRYALRIAEEDNVFWNDKLSDIQARVDNNNRLIDKLKARLKKAVS